LITNPGITTENERARDWLSGLVYRNNEVVIPEIADYEVRRELLRARKFKGLASSQRASADDFLCLPIIAVMRKAAENWAAARQMGRPSADPSRSMPT